MRALSKLILWSDSAEIAKAIESSGLIVERLESLEEVLARLESCDALVMSAALASQSFMFELKAKARKLRWLHLLNAGFDNVAEEGLPNNATLTYSPGAGSRMVAEHAVALMLGLSRCIPETLGAQARQEWGGGIVKRLTSLSGKTAMIFGMGHIGKQLARHLRHFGMRIIAVNRTKKSHELADLCCSFAEVEENLPNANFVIIAAPLSAETVGYFDRRRLTMFGKGAYLINLSRGGLVDSEALVDMLGSGHLAGAAVDVTFPEPLPKLHSLWSASNLIISPHVAAVGGHAEDIADLAKMAGDNARRFAGNKPLLYTVGSSLQRPPESGSKP